MVRRLWLTLIVSLFVVWVQAQHLIGLPKDRIETEAKRLFPGYVLDNSSINHTYKYLKFKNKFEERTLLVFLTAGDSCSSTKLICDYSAIDELKNDLNSKYTEAGRDQWIYSVNGVVYMVKLKREEWFFTVFTTKKRD